MFEGGQIRGRGPLSKGAPRESQGEPLQVRAKEFSGEGTRWAWVAQLVERVLGKDEVTGSIPVPGSTLEGQRG